MNEINTIEKLKQCFGKIIPNTDSCTRIYPLIFMFGFIFSHKILKNSNIYEQINYKILIIHN